MAHAKDMHFLADPQAMCGGEERVRVGLPCA
jgi:hypothetical protein